VRGEKFIAQSGTSFFIPVVRAAEVGLGLGPDGDGPVHRRDSRIWRKTSRQGSPGLGSRSKFRERLVERLPFGGRGCAAIQQVGFVEFGEPGEKLGAVADGQPGQFFKDLRFAHGVNLARLEFSRKHGVERSHVADRRNSKADEQPVGELRWRREQVWIGQACACL
jgi:hypothetical protein